MKDSNGKNVIYPAHYIFSLDKPPTNSRDGWTADTSSESDLVLVYAPSLKKMSFGGIWENHIAFNFHRETGAFCVVRKSSSIKDINLAELTVNGKPVVSGSHELNQHSMNIRIGSFEYLFEYTPFACSERFEQGRRKYISDAWPRKIDKQFHMPAPMPQTRTIGPWTLNRPMGCGVFGRVYLASNSDSEVVAIKIVLRRNEPNSELESELRSELGNLRKLTQLVKDNGEEGRIVRLREMLRSTGINDINSEFGPFEEVGFVLEPMTPHTFEDLIEGPNLCVYRTYTNIIFVYIY